LALDCQLRTADFAGELAMLLYLIWQCLKCGYALVAKDPPDKCPDCGAPREEFVLIEED
jgi:rubrerythrin